MLLFTLNLFNYLFQLSGKYGRLIKALETNFPFFESKILPQSGSRYYFFKRRNKQTPLKAIAVLSSAQQKTTNTAAPHHATDSRLFKFITHNLNTDKRLPLARAALFPSAQKWLMASWNRADIQYGCNRSLPCIAPPASFSVAIFPIIYAHGLGCHGCMCLAEGHLLLDYTTVALPNYINKLLLRIVNHWCTCLPQELKECIGLGVKNNEDKKWFLA